jgi:hypothetical protein
MVNSSVPKSFAIAARGSPARSRILAASASLSLPANRFARQHRSWKAARCAARRRFAAQDRWDSAFFFSVHGRPRLLSFC